MILTGIQFYPIKSLRGIPVESAPVEPRGLRHDRRWMVTDADFEFLTQREVPRMALVDVRLEGGYPIVSAPELPELRLAPAGPERRVVRVFKDSVDAVVVGGEADEWFSRYLGFPAHVVYMDGRSVRDVNPRYGAGPVSFADGFPLLLAASDSLLDLNLRLSTPLSMSRFRPNLIVSGAPPFAEDQWKAIRIGEVELDVVKPCARCAIPTIDPDTAEQGDEPLRTLATFRKRDGKVYFGQNLIPRTTGTLRVGTEVEILESIPGT